MKDILHPLCLTIAGIGFLLLLRDLRNRERDPAVVALASTFGFSALSYAISITWVWVRIDGAVGITNVVVPLAQGCVMLVFAGQVTVLAYWSRPTEVARRRGRQFLLGAVIVIVGMVALFVLLDPSVERPYDFSMYYSHAPYFQAYVILYMSAYTAADSYLAWACWKYARSASDRSIAVGLRLIAVGAVITLGYSGIRMAVVLGAIFGFTMKGDLNAVAWLCGDLGAAITQIGYFLPILTRRIEDANRWRKAHVMYRRLGELWDALAQANPGITLREPDSQRGAVLHGRSADFPLLRRRVEIRHGQKLLRRYLDPALRAESETRRAVEGLTGPQLAAAVTADQIHDALVRSRTGAFVGAPVEYADVDLKLPTDEDELLHLVSVASFFSPPLPETTGTALASPASGALS